MSLNSTNPYLHYRAVSAGLRASGIRHERIDVVIEAIDEVEAEDGPFEDTRAMAEFVVNFWAFDLQDPRKDLQAIGEFASAYDRVVARGT